MPLVKVAALTQLPPGSVMEASVGGRPYAVCNVDGQIYALDGTCPHQGGPLGEGALEGTMLTCPWHAWSYDCRTGVNDFDADVKVETFPVQIDGDDILLETPSSAGAA